MNEVSIPQNRDPEPAAHQKRRIIVVTGITGDEPHTLVHEVTESTARPITVVENFYEAIGELTTTSIRNAPDAVIADTRTFGHRVREFSLALRKTDPAITILAVAEKNGFAAPEHELEDLAEHVDAVLTFPLNRLELERAIQTADMAARQPSLTDESEYENSAAIVPSESRAEPSASPHDESEVEVEVEVETEAVAEPPLPATPAPANRADHDLLDQLLQAPDPAAVAAALELELISLHPEELVDIRIVFQADALAEPDATPILYQGRLVALLIARGLDPEERQAHADWAAPYLAMSQQLMTYRDMAYTDELTSAHNRRYFNVVLPQAIDTARTQRECVTLLLFDIDNFKKFNDQFGHSAGDRILIETVSLLKSVIRPTDQVCRLGGDEFAVIFFDAEGSRQPGSNHPDDITQIAQRFQAQIAEQRFPELGAKAPGKLTISGGLATFPWDAHDALALYEFADHAALAAKRSGKNHITLGPAD